MARVDIVDFVRMNDASAPRWASYLQKAWAKERVQKLRYKVKYLEDSGRWNEARSIRAEFGMDAPDFLTPLQKPAKKREKVYIPVEYRRRPNMAHRMV